MFNENTWKEGELLALKFMKKLGYKIVFTNFNAVGVELDIVAICPKKVQQKVLKTKLKEEIKQTSNKNNAMLLKQNYNLAKKTCNDLLVITEVKARSTEKFGLGAEAVSLKKQAHIRRGAEFLLKMDRFRNATVRFDVASVDAGKVNYIENAF